MRTMTTGWVFLCSIAAGAFGQDRPSLQDATNRVRSAGAVDDPDALRKLWGPSHSGAPADPDAPTPPPVPDAPFAPREWLVIDGECDAVAAIQGFVTRMLIVREHAPVADDAVAWDDAKRWVARSTNEAGTIDAPACVGFTAIERDRDGVWMANLQGASHLFVNGELFVGDVERRGYRGVPVFLRKGRNDVFVFGIDNAFSLSFWQPGTRVVMADWDCFLPRHAEELQASSGEILGGDLWLPVFNASMRPCTFLHRHHGKVGPSGSLFYPGDWADGGRIVPLGIDHTRSFVGLMEDPAPFDETAGGWIPLKAYAEDDRLADVRVLEFSVKGNGRMARPSRPVLGMLARCSGALRTIGGRGETPARFKLIVSSSGSDAEDAASIAVARWMQQVLWYTADTAAALSLDTEYEDDRTSGKTRPSTWYVWIGCGAASGVFAKPLNERIASRVAGDARAARLAVVDFVEAPDNRGHMAAIVAADVRGLEFMYGLDPMNLAADATYVAKDGAITRE